MGAQETEILSDILECKILSCDDTDNKNTVTVNNDCTMNSEIIDIKNNTEYCENDEIFAQSEKDDTLRQPTEYNASDLQQFCVNALEKDDTLRQLAEYNASDSQQSFVHVFDNDSSDMLFGIESVADSNFKYDLTTWAVEHKITHTALNALLQTLKKHSCFSALPLDARSLLRTPRHQQELRTVEPGSYYHFGLADSIRKVLTFVKDNIDCIRIGVNIDGLPLSRSSQQQFWSILGSIIPYDNVFIIGIYHGNEKPANANDFLKEFVNEAEQLCANGIYINNRNIPCRVSALICGCTSKIIYLGHKRTF